MSHSPLRLEQIASLEPIEPGNRDLMGDFLDSRPRLVDKSSALINGVLVDFKEGKLKCDTEFPIRLVSRALQPVTDAIQKKIESESSSAVRARYGSQFPYSFSLKRNDAGEWVVLMSVGAGSSSDCTVHSSVTVFSKDGELTDTYSPVNIPYRVHWRRDGQGIEIETWGARNTYWNASLDIEEGRFSNLVEGKITRSAVKEISLRLFYRSPVDSGHVASEDNVIGRDTIECQNGSFVAQCTFPQGQHHILKVRNDDVQGISCLPWARPYGEGVHALAVSPARSSVFLALPVYGTSRVTGFKLAEHVFNLDRRDAYGRADVSATRLLPFPEDVSFLKKGGSRVDMVALGEHLLLSNGEGIYRAEGL